MQEQTKHREYRKPLSCTSVPSFLQFLPLKTGTATSQWRQISSPQYPHSLDCALLTSCKRQPGLISISTREKTTYLRSCCQMMLEQLWMPQERVHTQRKVESGSSLSLPEVSKNTAPVQVSAVCPLTKVLLTWVCYYQCHAVT